MIIGLPGNGIVGDPNQFGRSVSMSNNATDIAKIIQVLPGGGSSLVLSAGDFTITGMPASYLRKGNMNNTLLAQTITLGLNLGIDSELGSFALQSGTLATAAPAEGCGSETPMERSCSAEGYTPVINEYEYFDIPAVVDLLPTKTVQGLFDMANTALGGGTLPAGVTLAELAKAVDAINNAFDGCRISMGYDETPLTGCNEADRAGFIVYPVSEGIANGATLEYLFRYATPVLIEVLDTNLNVLSNPGQTDNFDGTDADKTVVLSFDFNSLPAGYYFIKITTYIGTKAIQVIKK
jgi:hypothetical protein